ncbi:MAG: response regulator [Candidatus Deferrimicrobium sp.]
MACEGNGKDIRLLVTDVIMPKMSGGELAEKLVARNKALRVLFISGYTGNVIERQGILPEGTNFLQKPFTSSDLGVKIREILA